MLFAVQLLLAGAAIVVGAWLAVVNARCAIASLRGQPAPSVVPLFGGIMLSVGLALFPGGYLRPLALFGVILDVGCLPYLSVAVFSVFADWWRYRPWSRRLTLTFRSSAGSGQFVVYPTAECHYIWARHDGMASGSAMLTLTAYDPAGALTCESGDLRFALHKVDGTWRLLHESPPAPPIPGVHDRPSLADATFVQIQQRPGTITLKTTG